ncbi:hypothetical protein [Gillisia sp. CAL575]|uniref:hypothetical protein n=1 Tax=Gillisia sp. CAL575 TaxID=985255 RepID=UPI00039BFBFA|nr:hypothetical protein [Gillisia sp. CAL575]
MSLYNPPLVIKSKRNVSSFIEITDALKGLEFSYFYTGKRIGKSDNIELNVCTVVIDSDENIFLSDCNYSGQKETWKEVIKNQIVNHLREIGVEPGIVKSETRYLTITSKPYLSKEKYELKVLDVISQINRKE